MAPYSSRSARPTTRSQALPGDHCLSEHLWQVSSIRRGLSIPLRVPPGARLGKSKRKPELALPSPGLQVQAKSELHEWCVRMWCLAVR